MKMGIDIGGSHIGIGLIDENFNIINKKEFDIPKIKTEIEEFLINVISDEIIKQTEHISLIGICSCGTVIDGKIVKADNLGIMNFELVKKIKEKIKLSGKKDIEFILRNDAKCAAMAEKHFGSLKKYDEALFLTIGTGIGGACFLDGKLVSPKKYAGLEVGHTIILKGGEKCNCGNLGCFETYGSITALKRMVKRDFNIEKNLLGKELLEIIIEKLNGNDIIEKEKMGKIIEEYTEMIAIGISNLINIFEPEGVSIGGSFVYYEEIFLEKIYNKLKLFNNDKPELVCATYKNDAGIIGSIII